MKEIHRVLMEFKKEFPAIYEGHEGLGRPWDFPLLWRPTPFSRRSLKPENGL